MDENELSKRLNEVRREWFPLIDWEKKCDGKCNKCNCYQAVDHAIDIYMEIEANKRLRNSK